MQFFLLVSAVAAAAMAYPMEMNDSWMANEALANDGAFGNDGFLGNDGINWLQGLDGNDGMMNDGFFANDGMIVRRAFFNLSNDGAANDGASNDGFLGNAGNDGAQNDGFFDDSIVCLEVFLGDGTCDDVCNTAEFNFDNGDC